MQKYDINFEEFAFLLVELADLFLLHGDEFQKLVLLFLKAESLV